MNAYDHASPGSLSLCLLTLFCPGCSGGQPASPEVGSPPPGPWTLEARWTASGVFKSPESALYDPVRNLIYVSNVNGYEENGAGYLSALGPDGEIIDAIWIEELNAPTGMAIAGDTLYVADFSRLAEIDIPTKTIRNFYAAPDGAKSGLNDIAIAPNGDVFVSASWLSAIYKLENGELVEWIKDDALEWANGLHADDDHLYVAAFYLRRINFASKEIEKIGDDSVLEDLESIEPDGKGGFFITQIGAKPIMHLSRSGTVTEVLSRSSFSADIDYAQSLGLLVVPSAEDTVVGFSARPNP